MLIRGLAVGEEEVCERIMRDLHGWFGIEASIVAYAQAVVRLETFVAAEAGAVVGFISIEPRSPVAAEIHVMAVRADWHGKGVGRALIGRAEQVLRERGCEYLQVKTMGPSRPNREYERTRGFYARVGFRPLEENRLWGEVIPCLIMVKHLDCRTTSP